MYNSVQFLHSEITPKHSVSLVSDKRVNTCSCGACIILLSIDMSVSAVLDQGLQADATAYFGRIQTDTPLGTVVFSFRIIIDRTQFTNNDLSAIIVSLVRNNLVQNIFRFSDGTTDRQFLIGLAGGIDAANSSRVFPEIRLHDSRYIVYEDSVIYQQAPPSSLELPTTLDFDLNILVVGVVTTDVSSLTPFAVGTVDIAVGKQSPSWCINVLCDNTDHIDLYLNYRSMPRQSLPKSNGMHCYWG